MSSSLSAYVYLFVCVSRLSAYLSICVCVSLFMFPRFHIHMYVNVETRGNVCIYAQGRAVHAKKLKLSKKRKLNENRGKFKYCAKLGECINLGEICIIYLGGMDASVCVKSLLMRELCFWLQRSWTSWGWMWTRSSKEIRNCQSSTTEPVSNHGNRFFSTCNYSYISGIRDGSVIS